MLSFKEYNRAKEYIHLFEEKIFLAAFRMKCDNMPKWTLKDAKIAIENGIVSVTVPDRTITIPENELKKYLKKGQWVVKYSSVHHIRKASIYRTKKEANDEYKFQLAHTAPDDQTVYWVAEPELMEWSDLAFYASHNPDEYDWC